MLRFLRAVRRQMPANNTVLLLGMFVMLGLIAFVACDIADMARAVQVLARDLRAGGDGGYVEQTA